MSAAEDRLAMSRRRAAEARLRFTATLATVKRELQPKRLVDNAVDGLKQKASRTAGDAVAFVRERPATVAAVAAAAALLLFRRPIAEAITGILGNATGSGDAALDAENPPPPALED